jgi:hypothetical protein
MVFMRCRFLSRLSVILVFMGVAFSAVGAGAQDDSSAKRGRKYKAPLPTARIEVTILKDVNGKPIENAAVIFHPMVGEKDEGNMELKTNEDGKTIIDVLPIGDTVRLQVIAKGFQTFGEDYKVDKAEMAVEIRMKRPGEQYSIYKNHDSAKSPSQATPPAQAPPANGNTSQPDAPPNSQSAPPQPKSN